MSSSIKKVYSAFVGLWPTREKDAKALIDEIERNDDSQKMQVLREMPIGEWVTAEMLASATDLPTGKLSAILNGFVSIDRVKKRVGDVSTRNEYLRVY